MSAIEVTGGDFKHDRRSRFESAAMVLCQQVADGHRVVRRHPADLVAFRIRDGIWSRVFDDANNWTGVFASAGLAGAPLAGANLIVPTIFFGQQALVTWANAMVGAVAAAAAMKSERFVRFEARFSGGEILHARSKERALMKRLPYFYAALSRRAR